MITVSELQSRRAVDIDKVLQEIERNIIRADESGLRTVNFHLKPNAPVHELLRALTDHGYTVRWQHGSDQRDGTWSYLDISWS